jgi:uncharacterized protein involved in exopolysaccharide biosynthesis
MRDSFDPFEYLDFLRGKRKFAALVVGMAVVAAVTGSLLMPNRYSSTASIIIEPPPGGDARIATAVSPVYIESLKTYEQFALSDSLFARACAKFGLPEGGGTIESYKRRVLHVAKLKETKVLQIRVTMTDPHRAQALAEYLARETVALSRSLAMEADTELVRPAIEQLSGARQVLEKCRAEAASVASQNDEASLETELGSLADQRTILATALTEAEARVAAGRGDADDIASFQARAGSLARQQAALNRSMREKGILLAQAKARRQQAESQLRSAQETYDAASRRVSEAESARGAHGEMLRLIDPGIVPQRPSSPDLPLNVVGALLAALLAVLAWTAVAFGIERRHSAPHARSPLRMARGAAR